jgi:hypothetical protein
MTVPPDIVQRNLLASLNDIKVRAFLIHAVVNPLFWTNTMTLRTLGISMT